MGAEINKECIRLNGKSKVAIIYSYVNKNGSDFFKQYFYSLEENDKEKLLALLDRWLKTGTIVNVQKFKYLQRSEKIFEFKSGSHRILSFYLPKKKPRSLVLLHGFKKQRGNIPKEQIKKAERIRKRILFLEKKGDLKILESE